MAAPTLDLSFMVDLLNAIRHARLHQAWVVVVCPDSAVTEIVAKTLATVLPAGSSTCGRTALLEGGGKISVAASDSGMFLPNGQRYVIALTGWKAQNQAASWANWASGADRVITAGV